MEEICIDVRGFSQEKKKRVQDAFFEMGYRLSTGEIRYLSMSMDVVGYCATQYGRIGFTRKYDWLSSEAGKLVTYAELMQKAGLPINDPDEIITLQKGDYTTREEIKEHAEREGLTLKESYQKICDALVRVGADIGEEVRYIENEKFKYYGWNFDTKGVFFSMSTREDGFTRHLTPHQILGAINAKKPDETPEPIIGKDATITFWTENKSDNELDSLETIKSYLSELGNTQDTKAREIIVAHIGKLLDVELQRLTGGDDE